MEVAGEEGGVRNTYELLTSRARAPLCRVGSICRGHIPADPSPPGAATPSDTREACGGAHAGEEQSATVRGGRGRRVGGTREARGERSTAAQGATLPPAPQERVCLRDEGSLRCVTRVEWGGSLLLLFFSYLRSRRPSACSYPSSPAPPSPLSRSTWPPPLNCLPLEQLAYLTPLASEKASALWK